MDLPQISCRVPSVDGQPEINRTLPDVSQYAEPVNFTIDEGTYEPINKAPADPIEQSLQELNSIQQEFSIPLNDHSLAFLQQYSQNPYYTYLVTDILRRCQSEQPACVPDIQEEDPIEKEKTPQKRQEAFFKMIDEVPADPLPVLMKRIGSEPYTPLYRKKNSCGGNKTKSTAKPASIKRRKRSEKRAGEVFEKSEHLLEGHEKFRRKVKLLKEIVKRYYSDNEQLQSIVERVERGMAKPRNLLDTVPGPSDSKKQTTVNAIFLQMYPQQEEQMKNLHRAANGIASMIFAHFLEEMQSHEQALAGQDSMEVPQEQFPDILEDQTPSPFSMSPRSNERIQRTMEEDEVFKQICNERIVPDNNEPTDTEDRLSIASIPRKIIQLNNRGDDCFANAPLVVCLNSPIADVIEQCDDDFKKLRNGTTKDVGAYRAKLPAFKKGEHSSDEFYEALVEAMRSPAKEKLQVVKKWTTCCYNCYRREENSLPLSLLTLPRVEEKVPASSNLLSMADHLVQDERERDLVKEMIAKSLEIDPPLCQCAAKPTVSGSRYDVTSTEFLTVRLPLHNDRHKIDNKEFRPMNRITVGEVSWTLVGAVEYIEQSRHYVAWVAEESNWLYVDDYKTIQKRQLFKANCVNILLLFYQKSHGDS